MYFTTDIFFLDITPKLRPSLLHVKYSEECVYPSRFTSFVQWLNYANDIMYHLYSDVITQMTNWQKGWWFCLICVIREIEANDVIMHWFNRHSCLMCTLPPQNVPLNQGLLHFFSKQAAVSNKLLSFKLISFVLN